MTIAEVAAPSVCEGCGTGLAPVLRACPSCQRLVHARELQRLAEMAQAAATAGDTSGELTAWRTSLDLLPPESRQFATIAGRVDALSRARDTQVAASPPPSRGAWKLLAVLGPAALLVWKFKFVLVFLLTKGKLILLGLTKSSTIFSMLLSVGVYWTAWGLPFAAGFVLSIYIHEMGHVAALRHYGIAATAPMFIPGVGAFVRLRQSPASRHEDARVGLAGPLWGLGAALAAYAGGMAGAGGLWLAIARTGAWINLFNLLPIWQLDGNRGFSALSRYERWIVVATFGVSWVLAGDGLFALLLLVGVVRALASDASPEGDPGVLRQFVAITLALAVLFRISG